MNAVLFPFSWISPAQLSALEAFSVRPVVLAPSEGKIPPELLKWQTAGRIEIVVPLRGDDDRLERFLREYRSWADAHRGTDISLARILEGEIPFFDDSHVAQIRSEIRRGRSGAGEVAGPDQRLTRARLFLLMAQEYDRQSREIEQDLEKLQGLESAMFTELHEGRRLPGLKGLDAPAAAFDSGRFMTEERIRAWCRLYLASGPAETAARMLVTPSRAVLEAVLEAAPDPETVRSAAVEAGGSIDDVAEALAAGRSVPEMPPSEGPKMALFFISDMDPARLFTRFLKTAEREATADRPEEATLLALVEMP
ncbi:MAG: hypothetical protein K9K88_19020 [Desulfobacterales bacterium]|nr:hypothetical protein [Desulfobacterales bacterium]